MARCLSNLKAAFSGYYRKCSESGKYVLFEGMKGVMQALRGCIADYRF
jgi:hypothetical protein